jgi:hypothetical protein
VMVTQTDHDKVIRESCEEPRGVVEAAMEE